MSNCKELELGEQGMFYICDCLRNGKSLGRRLLTLLNRECGQVAALLPQDVDLKRMPELVSEFRYGGISRIGGTLTCLSKMTQEFLTTDSSHICIIEDTIAQREDGWLAACDAPALFLGSDVYYFLSSEHHDDLEEIRKIVSALDAQRVTGVMTSLPEGKASPNGRQEITLEDVDEFASRAQMIVVDAYDGEGYLIWRRE